jgi:hypothetical protein
MNHPRPPTIPGDPGRPPENLDGLLRAFFQAEMPASWPAPELPAESFRRPPRPAARWAMTRSRLALAASVALLVTPLFFFGSPRPAEPDAAAPGRIIGQKYDMKESLFQEVEEKKGPDGKPRRHEQPTKYLIEFYERF